MTRDWPIVIISGAGAFILQSCRCIHLPLLLLLLLSLFIAHLLRFPAAGPAATCVSSSAALSPCIQFACAKIVRFPARDAAHSGSERCQRRISPTLPRLQQMSGLYRTSRRSRHTVTSKLGYQLRYQLLQPNVESFCVFLYTLELSLSEFNVHAKLSMMKLSTLIHLRYVFCVTFYRRH